MISVIIPLYNKEKCIRKTIDSILYQKNFSDFEIVVVDDESTDNSCMIVDSIGDKRIVLYHKINGGPASARNFGVLKAKGEWIIFIDADDYFLPDALNHFADLSQRHLDYSCFSANFYTEFDGVRLLNSYLMKTGRCTNPFKKLLTKQFTCRTGAAMFRREVLLENPFDEKLRRFEDAENNFRLMKVYPFFTSSKPVMVYNQDSKEASSYRKDSSEDYLTHLVPSNGSFWERVVMYHFYQKAYLAYPNDAKSIYNRNDFECIWYKLALLEIKVYLKINRILGIIKNGINK